jgi:F-type H+-transporting ATPase subunit gamma
MELDAILKALASASDDDAGSARDVMLDIVFTDEQHPLRVDRDRFFEQKPTKRPGIILVTADRGLAGAFNTRLIRAATEFMSQHGEMESRLITIGRKGHTYFKKRNIPIIYHREGLNDRVDLGEIREVTERLVRFYVEDDVDSLYIIYTQFKTALQSTVKIEKFLSIPPVEGSSATEGIYILEPDRDSVYEQLLPLYATTKIFATMADSFASEYGARMAAMQLATKNAEEMLDDLILYRNRMRQAMITKELAEIVGGAETQE